MSKEDSSTPAVKFFTPSKDVDVPIPDPFDAFLQEYGAESSSDPCPPKSKKKRCLQFKVATIIIVCIYIYNECKSTDCVCCTM